MGNCLCFDWFRPKDGKMHRSKQLECSTSRPSSDSGIQMSNKFKAILAVSEKSRLVNIDSPKHMKHMILVKMILPVYKIKPESTHLAFQKRKHEKNNDDEFYFAFFKAVKLTRQEGIIQAITKHFANIIDIKNEYPIEMIHVFDPYQISRGPKFEKIGTKHFLDVLPNGSIWTVQFFKRYPESQKYVMHFSGCEKMLAL